MILSMTGFGKSSYAGQRFKIDAEAKSINSKQLDLNLRIPSLFREHETVLRNILSTILERGKVDLIVNVEFLQETESPALNLERLKDYKNQIEKISSELGIPVPHEWFPILLRLPDTLQSKSFEAEETEIEAFLNVCKEAAENLNNSRLNEGKKLFSFFFEKLERISALLGETDKFEINRIPKIRERLEQQLQKLESIEFDKGRLEQELIFYIEKLDVTEEKVRLKSHIDYFAETLGEPGESSLSGKGKKLGFIAQEMGREINTLGSKANDADLQKIVVMMKDELEQIKEQVLNVL